MREDTAVYLTSEEHESYVKDSVTLSILRNYITNGGGYCDNTVKVILGIKEKDE